jgi:hypothetical protein
MSWGKIYCDTNWGENKYRTAGSIINEATPDCFQFPEFVSFKDHVRSEGATYEKMQCGIDILLFLGRSISITPQSPDNPTFSGILDTYTGATAGYSTRRLTNTYTGGLIRVRRSSDDAEQDIGYDANGEDLDIFGLLAFVGSQNLADWSENFGNFGAPSNVTLTSGISDPFGGTDATDLTSTSDAWLLRDNLSHIQNGTQYTISIYARAKTSGVKNGFRFIMGTAASSNIEATTTWTRYTATFTANGTACGIFRTSPNSFAEIEIYGFQINEGTSAQSYATTSGTYLEGNGAVTTWYDQTGNGNHATNSTASEQPLIVEGGDIIYEGATISRPAIQFDGSDDTLLSSTSFTQPYTAFAVRKFDSNSDQMLVSHDTSTFLGVEFRFVATTRLSNGTYLNHSVSPTTTQGLLYALGNGSNSEISIDGGTTTTGNSGSAGASELSIGGRSSYYFGGAFQEVIYFDSDQSSNRTGIEGNIDNYFRITS